MKQVSAAPFDDELMALHAYSDPDFGNDLAESDLLLEKATHFEPHDDAIAESEESRPLRRRKPLFPKLSVESSAISLALKSETLTRSGAVAPGGPIDEIKKRRIDQSMMRWEATEADRITVRVLDVDKLNLAQLHSMFMHSLVRRLPAEKCMKVIGRLGMFRDKKTQQGYENLMSDSAEHFGKYIGPEAVALFARCHATLSVPFAVDYVRRFGRFSRWFQSREIDRSSKPKVLDFCRFPGGVRPLPPLVTRPHELWPYVRLLPKCSAKRYMIQHLLAQQVGKSRMNYLLDGMNDSLNDALGGDIDPDTKLVEELVKRQQKKRSNLRPKMLDVVMNSKAVESVAEIPTSALALQNLKVAAVSDETQVVPVSENSEAENAITETPAWWANEEESFTYKGKLYRKTASEGWKRIIRKTRDYGRQRRIESGLKRKENSERKRLRIFRERRAAKEYLLRAFQK